MTLASLGGGSARRNRNSASDHLPVIRAIQIRSLLAMSRARFIAAWTTALPGKNCRST